MEIITRSEAHEKGLKRFFTGKVCKRGHIRERNVKTGACLGCLSHYAKQYSSKYNDEALGFVSVGVSVHPDDVGRIQAFADLIRAARIAGTPVPLVPRADQVTTMNTMLQMLEPAASAPQTPQTPPAPVVDDVQRKHAMWVRIHGQEVADQMIASGM